MKIASSSVTFSLVTFASLVLLGTQALAQVTHPGSGSQAVNVSGGETFVDTGGLPSNYSNDESGVTTMCPSTPGNPITLDIDAFAVEERAGSGCWDTFTVYDGDTTGDPVLVSGCGDPDDQCSGNASVCIQAGDSVSATNADGCLTVEFDSDGSITYSGWEISVSVQGGLQDADLALTKSVSPPQATVGDTVTYELQVTNNGPGNAENVVITDNLPPTLSLVSTAGCAEDPGGSPTCTVGNLANGTSATVQIQAQVSSNGAAVNSASVTADNTDPATANNAASAPLQLVTATVPLFSSWSLALMVLVLSVVGLSVLRMRSA